MKRLLCPELPQPGRPASIPVAEAEHAVRVLRLRDGEKVEAMDGKGHAVIALLKIKAGPPRLEFVAAHSMSEQKITPLVLEMCVLKGDAMEWVVEKCVELGVQAIAPVLSAHTIVQMKNKGPEQFRERWQKIADQSLKQCGRLEKMEIFLPAPLDQVILQAPEETRLWCDETAADGSASHLMDWVLSEGPHFPARLLIGPEGGWSDAERTFLFRTPSQRLSLGSLTLRAETAAIFGCGILSAAFQTGK